MLRYAVTVLGILVLTVSLATAQAPAPAGGGQRAGGNPAPMKNLQVLPKDMPQPEVVAIMRAFNGALGVQCGHCHIWTKPGDPSNDMAADTKIEKTVARVMIDQRDQLEARRQHQEAGRSDCACGVRDVPSRRRDSRHAAPAARARTRRRARGATGGKVVLLSRHRGTEAQRKHDTSTSRRRRTSRRVLRLRHGGGRYTTKARSPRSHGQQSSGNTMTR